MSAFIFKKEGEPPFIVYLEVPHLLFVLCLTGLGNGGPGWEDPLYGVQIVGVGLPQHLGLRDLDVVVGPELDLPS